MSRAIVEGRSGGQIEGAEVSEDAEDDSADAATVIADDVDVDLPGEAAPEAHEDISTPETAGAGAAQDDNKKKNESEYENLDD
jgi:hypothetical protein